MNEQLVVKNFGPIKDATVEFKRVTVFIGPTGGGKSTLAKLAAIMRIGDLQEAKYSGDISDSINFKQFSLRSFFNKNSILDWLDKEGKILIEGNQVIRGEKEQVLRERFHQQQGAEAYKRAVDALEKYREITLSTKGVDETDEVKRLIGRLAGEFLKEFYEIVPSLKPTYIPAERSFVATIEYSWAGLMRDNIGLPKILLDFANSFSLSRKEISELEIPFLNVKYLHIDGRDFIKIPEREEPLMLLETASGIQSVTPLLVLLEHLSRNTEQAQSFIIEEPELNLYPTAQQGLLNWLMEKCTTGENDLTITTHSPYILSHLNLLLYAYQVGNKDEEKRAKVKAIIPEEYWINPDDFAAYYVNGSEGKNGVRSLVDAETKLISQNGLDTVSGIQADQFDQLLDINSGF